MAKFPEADLLTASDAQAFVVPAHPEDGFLRLVAAGKAYHFQLPRRAFVQLARQIQSADSQAEIEIPSLSEANGQD
ncbi:MAG TPA: hypothetical protein VMU56_04405 [Beijerinckiaceae bacterium]|nr:hypothetical protein [Beijerinckiaceae bacterium]HVB89656.1 hypothetical protein [Beijerinckiaceae bacterium]